MFGKVVTGVCPKCSKKFATDLGITALYKDSSGSVYNKCSCPLCGAAILIKDKSMKDGLMRRYPQLYSHRGILESLVDIFASMAELPDASDYAKSIKGEVVYAQLSYEDLVTLIELAQVIVADLKESTVSFNDSFERAGTACY